MPNTPLNQAIKGFALKFSLVFLIACGSGAQSSETSENTDSLNAHAQGDSTSEDSTPIDEYEPVEESESEAVVLNEAELNDSLRKYFDEEWIQIFEKSKARFGRISSVYDFVSYYRSLNDTLIYELGKKLNGYGGKPEEEFIEMKLNWWNSYFSMIGFVTLCSDEEGVGTVCNNRPVINLTSLLEKAKSTNEKADDQFIEMLGLLTNADPSAINSQKDPLFYIDDYYGWLINDGCDWCTVSQLGDNHRSDMLQRMEGGVGARGLFSKEFETLLRPILDVHYDHYYYSKAKVLQELDLMLASVKKSKLLMADELAKLQSDRTTIKGMDNKVFNCGEGGGCDFGPSPFEN